MTDKDATAGRTSAAPQPDVTVQPQATADRAPFCPRCGGTMVETSAEVRQNPKNALWRCTVSNCQGRIFPAFDSYADENQYAGYSANVFTMKQGKFEFVGDAATETDAGKSASENIKKEWIKKAGITKRHQQTADTIAVGVDDEPE